MDTEDWESCSDNEVYLEDRTEDDDEEDCYSSGLVSRLQFRDDVSKAQWVDDLAMAEAVEKKGKMWVTMGIVRYGYTYFSIEETLFLVELGALHVLDGNGMHLSLKELYEKLLDEKGIPPSRVQIEAVERKHGNVPLKFCQVENGRVSFFSFAKVELPVLP